MSNQQAMLDERGKKIDIAKKSTTNQANMRLGFRIELDARPHPQMMPWWAALMNQIATILQRYDAQETNKSATQVRPWRLEVSHKQERGGRRGVVVA